MAKDWDLESLGIDPDDFDEDDEINAIISYPTIDATDVFATILQRSFPLLLMDRNKVLPWRYAWAITVPANTDYDVKDVETLCFETSQRLYWEKDELVGYSVAGPGA